MRTRALAAAGTLALAGAALVTAPAQAEVVVPTCTYHVSTKPSGAALVTVQAYNAGPWTLRGIVGISLTDLGISGFNVRALDPTTQSVTLNETRLANGHPFTVDYAAIKARKLVPHGPHVSTDCTQV